MTGLPYMFDIDRVSVSSDVAANIRRERKARNLTQAALADQVTASGHAMSLKTLSKIETGERGIGIEDVWAIARVFWVSIDALVKPTDLRRFELSERLDKLTGRRIAAQIDLIDIMSEIASICEELGIGPA